MRLILPIFAALILTGCDPEDFAPGDRYKADFHYTLKPSDRLSVENFNGEIEIAGWDDPSIEITGVRYASTQEMLDAIKIDIHESPAITEIRTEHPTTFHGSQGARVTVFRRYLAHHVLAFQRLAPHVGEAEKVEGRPNRRGVTPFRASEPEVNKARLDWVERKPEPLKSLTQYG